MTAQSPPIPDTNSEEFRASPEGHIYGIVDEPLTAIPAAVAGLLATGVPIDGIHVYCCAAGARALPDAEIVAGTPMPAIVPLPGKGLPPMPARGRTKHTTSCPRRTSACTVARPMVPVAPMTKTRFIGRS